MVRVSWTGVPIAPVPVVSSYRPEQLRSSHFRPVADLARITFMNIGLVLQSWIVPQPVRAAWSRGEHPGMRKTIAGFFADHAERPAQLAGAVGLGLFCGIAPIWGYQMVAAALLAHWLRLNKAIALLASNISIPPVAPFILYGGLALGHWLFTGRPLEFSLTDFTRTRALEYTGQWLVGSVVLGLLIALAGTVITYATARICKWRFNPAAPR